MATIFVPQSYCEIQNLKIYKPLCFSSKCCIKSLTHGNLTEHLNECVGITMTTYLRFHRDQMKKLWWIRVGPAQFSTFTMRKKSWKVRTVGPCNGENSERQPCGRDSFVIRRLGFES